jgi:hypothetical protein
MREKYDQIIMSCKSDFLDDTGIRRNLQVLFLTGKLCILEESHNLIVFFTKRKSPF